MKKKVVIIGLGNVGFGYDKLLSEKFYVLTHSRAFFLHPKFDIVAGVDKSLKTQNEFAKMYSCKVYSDTKNALLENKVDIAVVATPTLTHLKVIEDIFSYSSPSVIICEKPLAYTLDDSKSIISLCKKNNSNLFVNYMRNSSSAVRNIISKINENKIQPPFKVVNWYSKGIINSASHFITLFNLLFGNPVSVDIIDKSSKESISKLEGLDSEPDFNINYENSEVFFHSLDNLNYFHNSFKIYAKNGMLSYDNGGEFISWYPLNDNGVYSGYKVLAKDPIKIESNFNNLQLEFVNSIWENINGNSSLICSGTEALSTMNVINKILNLQNEK